MKKSSVSFCLFFLLCIGNLTVAQKAHPFQKEIDAFKIQDGEVSPPKHPILFVGSSSFTKWKTITKDFPDHPILNRGFGGSQLVDLIEFADETIFKYRPKQLYIYCGENDLAKDTAVTPAMVLERYQLLHKMIRKKLGKKLPVVYISIKPSLARWKLEPAILSTNRLIKAFLDTDKNARFIDVHQPMLDEHQEVLKDIFVADRLHMNEKGYAIWIKIIAPTLLQ